MVESKPGAMSKNAENLLSFTKCCKMISTDPDEKTNPSTMGKAGDKANTNSNHNIDVMPDHDV